MAMLYAAYIYFRFSPDDGAWMQVKAPVVFHPLQDPGEEETLIYSEVLGEVGCNDARTLTAFVCIPHADQQEARDQSYIGFVRWCKEHPTPGFTI